MDPLRVFIGLVSHSKSKFAENQGPQGLAKQLQMKFADLGVVVSCKVNTSNIFDENPYPLTPKMARRSVTAEIEMESKWSAFLQRKDHISQRIRILARTSRYFLDLKRHSETTELRRLLNIEYSHLDLYRAGVASGADWIVILEDDADCSSPFGLTQGLKAIFNSMHAPKFINLSSSFSLNELGITHLVSPVNGVTWEGSGVHTVLSLSRPATNTVCAIAFRRDFLVQVLAEMDSQPIEPVIPIDWKLNASLMALWEKGIVGPHECWFLEPGPVVQLSMTQD